MAIALESGATGNSHVLLPDKKMEAYNLLHGLDFEGEDSREFPCGFGQEDPVREMIGMASLTRFLLVALTWCVEKS